MDKRKNKIFLKRAFSLMLSAVVLFTGLPLEMLAAPQSMESKVADEDVLLLQNDSISVRMSGQVKTADFISQMWKVIRQ